MLVLLGPHVLSMLLCCHEISSVITNDLYHTGRFEYHNNRVYTVYVYDIIFEIVGSFCFDENSRVVPPSSRQSYFYNRRTVRQTSLHHLLFSPPCFLLLWCDEKLKCSGGGEQK